MIFSLEEKNKYILITLIKNATIKLMTVFPHTRLLLTPCFSICMFASEKLFQIPKTNLVFIFCNLKLFNLGMIRKKG